MAATSLPLELQQQIFSFLDARSFAAARVVCRWWRYSATESVTLAQQLRRLPILPEVRVADSTPRELQELFNEALYKMLLGVRAQPHKDAVQNEESGSWARASRMGLTAGARVVVTPTGHRTVTLRDRILTLYDTSGSEAHVVSRRVINDLEETVGSGPWLRVNYNHFEMALSSTGKLLAIAQDRTVQIYDLEAEPDSFTVNYSVGNNSGPCIGGVEFTQDDYLLRVGLRAKGSVLYLGAPAALSACSGDAKTPATIEHWKGRHGLRHTFLESSLLRGDKSTQICGIQLLEAFENGYVFAAQTYGGGEPRQYVFGHVQVADFFHNLTPGASTVDHESVTIFTRLEAAHSFSRFYTSRPSYSHCSSSAIDPSQFWLDRIPSAHEPHPRFALSTHADNDHDLFLALVESDKRPQMQRLPMALAHAYVYRLPRHRLWHELLAYKTSLAQEASARDLHAPHAHDDDDDDEYNESDDENLTHSPLLVSHDPCSRAAGSGLTFKPPTLAANDSPYTIPRIPLCVGSLRGRLAALSISQTRPGIHALHAITTDSKFTWSLSEYS